MGSSGNVSTPKIEQTPVAAVARDARPQAEMSTAAENEARARRRGISSTYTRFSNNGGLSTKLGGD